MSFRRAYGEEKSSSGNEALASTWKISPFGRNDIADFGRQISSGKGSQ
jgi:hypothetical protein